MAELPQQLHANAHNEDHEHHAGGQADCGMFSSRGASVAQRCYEICLANLYIYLFKSSILVNNTCYNIRKSWEVVIITSQLHVRPTLAKQVVE